MPRYVFVWDQEAREVVASYYVERPGDHPAYPPADVSHGAIRAGEEEARLDELRRALGLPPLLRGAHGPW
jgi:hypothetical protein